MLMQVVAVAKHDSSKDEVNLRWKSLDQLSIFLNFSQRSASRLNLQEPSSTGNVLTVTTFERPASRAACLQAF